MKISFTFLGNFNIFSQICILSLKLLILFELTCNKYLIWNLTNALIVET